MADEDDDDDNADAPALLLLTVVVVVVVVVVGSARHRTQPNSSPLDARCLALSAVVILGYGISLFPLINGRH